MRYALLLLALSAGAGCTVPLPLLQVDAGPDAVDAGTAVDAAGERDAGGGTDAAEPLDAGLDAFVPPDAPPDAGPSCTSTYGALPMFMLCAETATTCEFFVRTSGSCDTMCTSRGGTCIEAYNDGVPVCTRMERLPCSMAYLQQICICSR